MSPAMFFTRPIIAMSGSAMDWSWHKMFDANNYLTIGSDWGANLDPSLMPALMGITETVGWGSKEMGGELLCRMITANGAEVVGKERDLSKGDFDGARIERTVFEGECVWDADS
ncbi:hypothetical protein P154DRAFT_574003 [Amniculicola lignicola CBS 123094]|uniref:Amidohydrolase-related domain-containing protein n=1 Tax=Amniculicola lignicola CBS 123094 TaxID=1392246 RepID=A0A6A5WL59_9PLEO|nr:hypothetical protein P154DRAFT_574003 [Amniculicola lignicola CBS 123094]